MQASEKVRSARKDMQEKRLALKGSDDYATFYANQPLQKVKAAKNEEMKSARTALRDAIDNLQVAEITGEGLKAAQEAHAIAALVVHKLDARDNARSGSQLSAAGA
jgi:hypothetical protein